MENAVDFISIYGYCKPSVKKIVGCGGLPIRFEKLGSV
jgi:hypothetical protein